MDLNKLAEKLYPAFVKRFGELPSFPCRLFLSASTMRERATVCNVVRDTPEDAWTAALNALKKELIVKGGFKPSILRADWVTTRETLTWADFLERVATTRRNWFRRGLALDKDYRLAFLEQELNANLILYNETDEARDGEFIAEKADAYCRRRFDCPLPTLADSDEVELFDTTGVFVEDKTLEPLTITGTGENAGRRDTPKGDAEFFLKLARNGANHLARQCDKRGRFVYGIFPCDDSVVPSYNSLRHFSSLFAMMDVYSTYGKMGGLSLGKAISKGLEYGIKKFMRYRKFDDGSEAAYLEDRGQFKLGASGTVLITLAKWSELQHTKKYIPLMRAVARGIFSMQHPNGKFIHVLNSEDFTIRDEFRTPFYDGEAVFGMLRLYGLTKDAELLAASEKAFEYFIATDHWKNYDHWLSYAVNELTIYKPEKKYFEFGLNNCLPYLPFIRDRDTYWPTLLELIMAAYNMLCRMQTMPEMSELVQRVNWDEFHEALNIRAERLLNGYFWPETAMYFQNPEHIVGGFCIRHHLFRVRIDDVQHYLSGFVAYSKYLRDENNQARARAIDYSVSVPSINPMAEIVPAAQPKPAPKPTVNAPVAQPTIVTPTAQPKPVVNAPAAQSSSETNESNDLKRMVIGGNVRITIEAAPSEFAEITGSQVQTVAAENKNPPLRVGVLRRSKNIWHPQHTTYAMFYVAKQFNIELLLFNINDVDFENKTINATFLEGNAKVQRVVPYPKIIENTILFGDDRKKLELLEKDCYVIRHSLRTTKQKDYNMLRKDGRFKEFLIESHNIDTFEQILPLIEQYQNDVILKPRDAGKGFGVARVTLQDGQYVVNYKNEKFFLKTVDEFQKFYDENFSEQASGRKYMLQPHINSRTLQGNPFDIRIHSRRGAGGKFKVSPFPRIGNAAGVISNIHAGGYSMNLDVFLKVNYGDDWKAIYNRLMEFGKVFPDYYQSFFPVTIFDIGIDIGIQKRGDVYEFKIFEVNTYIDGPFFEIEDAITHFEYFRYIDQKLREGSLKIG